MPREQATVSPVWNLGFMINADPFGCRTGSSIVYSATEAGQKFKLLRTAGKTRWSPIFVRLRNAKMKTRFILIPQRYMGLHGGAQSGNDAHE